MVREEADHLTRRERAELLRNHSANAKCLLEDAVRARRRAATVCRAPGGPTRESWNMLCQALAVESKLRQEYFDLLSHCEPSASGVGSQWQWNAKRLYPLGEWKGDNRGKG